MATFDGKRCSHFASCCRIIDDKYSDDDDADDDGTEDDDDDDDVGDAYLWARTILVYLFSCFHVSICLAFCAP